MVVVTAWRSYTIEMKRKNRGKKSGMAASMKSINSNQDLLMTQMLMSWARITAAALVDKMQEKVNAAKAALDDAMAAATKAVEEDVGKANAEAERLRGELELVRKDLQLQKDKAEALEHQITEAGSFIEDRKQKFDNLVAELEESRRKARDIGEELAKVGIFLQNAAPRKQSRPRSGAKADPNVLPKLGKEPGRPMSGTRGGSKGGAPKAAWNEGDSY